MELFVGVLIGFFIQSMVRFGWRVLNPPRPTPPQPPRTPAQLANEALYEDQVRHHPRVVSVRFSRRTSRGRHRRIMERQQDNLED